MINEFTIQEIQLMLQATHDTRKENLRLQSLTTNEFLLTVLTTHYHTLLNDTAELQTMKEQHPDFVLAVY